MELMSVASSKNKNEIEMLEKLSVHFHSLSREETKRWLWNAIDDLSNRGEDIVNNSGGRLPSPPPEWDIELSDLADYIETHNQYAIIYVLCHRLLFCNGELDKLSA